MCKFKNPSKKNCKCIHVLLDIKLATSVAPFCLLQQGHFLTEIRVPVIVKNNEKHTMK